LGLSATPVNAEVFSPKLQMELAGGKFCIILTLPEMCLEHKEFSRLMRTPSFTENICAVAINEAHCASHWGENFRKKYAELHKLHAFVPCHVPFLATSATLPPHILNDVMQKLCIRPQNTYFVNRGNDRPNITVAAFRMAGGASNLSALNFALDEAIEGGSLERTIIFFNDHDTAMRACSHL
ncbi:hypothetical protein WOLCODRAFT_77371, partial [Wolfiporia cocos MD-104 SS10]